MPSCSFHENAVLNLLLPPLRKEGRNFIVKDTWGSMQVRVCFGEIPKEGGEPTVLLKKC